LSCLGGNHEAKFNIQNIPVHIPIANQAQAAAPNTPKNTSRKKTGPLAQRCDRSSEQKAGPLAQGMLDLLNKKPQNVEIGPQNVEIVPQIVEIEPQNVESVPQSIEIEPQNAEIEPRD